VVVADGVADRRTLWCSGCRDGTLVLAPLTIVVTWQGRTPRAKITYTENANCGVYCVMKRKFRIIGLCGLLALVASFAFLSRDGWRPATNATKSQLVIAPDGTFAVPQNDYVTMLADVPKPTTNASPATMPPRKK
jgi:hypothetical protein